MDSIIDGSGVDETHKKSIVESSIDRIKTDQIKHLKWQQFFWSVVDFNYIILCAYIYIKDWEAERN